MKSNMVYILIIILTIGNVFNKRKKKKKLNETLKISIIIPVYNVEKYLHQCLNSVINQTYKNLEIICINDGSKDNSSIILNEYLQKDNRIVIVNQKNSGVSSARNKGIRLSTGDFISFIDSDDYLDLNVYEKCVQRIIRDNSDIIIFEKKKRKKFFDYLSINDSFSMIEGKQIVTYFALWNKIFKRKLINENNLFFKEDIDYGEDDLFRIMSFSLAKRISVLTGVSYHYRIRKDSVSHSIEKETMITEHIKRIKYLIAFFLEHKFYAQYDYLLYFGLSSTVPVLRKMENKTKTKNYSKEILKIYNDTLNLKKIQNISDENIKMLNELIKFSEYNKNNISNAKMDL